MIGTIRPGKNVLKFKVLEKSEAPFRLVGFAITNGDFNPSDMFLNLKRWKDNFRNFSETCECFDCSSI